MDQEPEASQGGEDNGTRRIAVVYGLTFGLGFSAVVVIGLVETSSTGFEAQANALLFVIPVLSALSSAVIAKQIGRGAATRIPWAKVLFVGGALGAVCGFSLAVSLSFFVIDVWNAIHRLIVGFMTIVGVPVGALTAVVLAVLLQIPQSRQRWIPIAGLLLGALLGTLVTVAFDFFGKLLTALLTL